MSTKTKTEHLRKMICQYAWRTGEEVKRGLPVLVREAYRNKSWKDSEKADGESFANLADWLTFPPPPGCGLGSTADSLTYDDLADICESVAPDVAKILRKERQKTRPGRKSKNGKENGIAPAQGRFRKDTRSTLAARLEQEKPKFYQGYLDGKYGSIRAAAEAAGIVQPGHDPLKRMKNYWKRATPEQQAEFRRWMKTKEAKTHK